MTAQDRFFIVTGATRQGKTLYQLEQAFHDERDCKFAIQLTPEAELSFAEYEDAKQAWLQRVGLVERNLWCRCPRRGCWLWQGHHSGCLRLPRLRLRQRTQTAMRILACVLLVATVLEQIGGELGEPTLAGLAYYAWRTLAPLALLLLIVSMGDPA